MDLISSLSGAERRGMSWVLRVAGGYNLVWGAFTVCFPNAFFDFAGMARLNHPEIWQCVGMIVGVYGVGYWIAAADPLRHWPIVLVGLLGKVLGPLGFLMAWYRGTFTWRAGLTNVTNDLIWWAPFAYILWKAVLRAQEARYGTDRMPLNEALETFRSSTGESLGAMSDGGPLLVVFLRHFGCTFCLEAIADLAKLRAQLEREGTTLVLVHMESEAAGTAKMAELGLPGVPQLADPSTRLYRAFELGNGTFRQILGLRTWVRGTQSFFNGHRAGRPQGSVLQMPGAFLVHRRKIVRALRHRFAGERPDYLALAKLPSAG